MIRKIAYVYPCQPRNNYSLTHSIRDEWRAGGITVDEFNLINNNNWYDTGVLDRLYEHRNEYDLVLVLDLGRLYDFRIHRDNYRCPVIMIAGDDPQNYQPKSRIKKIVHWLKTRVYASEKSSFEFYGNRITSSQYDIVLTNQKFCVEWYQKSGLEAHWLPYWCDTRNFTPDPAIRKEFDVTTVMYPRLRRKKIIRRLEKQQLFSFRNQTGISGKEVSDFYQKGRLVFNMSNHSEFTMRIPEVLGLGVCLLTDIIPVRNGLTDLFQDGRHLIYYRNYQDMIRKIRYYLDHPAEREAIAAEGLKEVLENHTEKARAAEILKYAREFSKPKSPKKVSFHILSWDRPLLLKMTLDSLKTALGKMRDKVEIILLDQNSHDETREIIKSYYGFIDKVLWMDENIGMARAWKKMYENTNADYIIPVENDWWCDRGNTRWLNDAIAILEQNPDMAFLKLRRINDRQYGKGSLEHEPWTVKPFPKDIVKDGYLNGRKKFYRSPAANCCFTFNPILMRKSFRDEMEVAYVDDAQNATPLRSGEDRPTAFWKNQTKWVAGTLLKGPFRHIGFMSIKEHLMFTPFYLIKFLLRKLLPWL